MTDPTRRQVLGAAAALGASLPGLPALHTRRRRVQEDGPDTLRVALVGCGGRGTGAAANALRADPRAKLVALADVFADHLEACHATLLAQPDLAERVDVPPDRRFVGWDAYRDAIQAADVVLLATSPHFRPLHVEAAVDAGRHLFVEKPVAVDAPGLRRMRAACDRAREQGLSVVTGLCYRYQRAKQETMRRVHDGAVGDVVALQCTYHATGLWYREPGPDWSPMEEQMRNWIYHAWLSGDHVAEQHVHSLDKVRWARGDVSPVKCTSSGGRIVRTEPRYGDVYDHFSTVFEWEDGVRAFSSCRQMNGVATDVSDYAFGSRGTAHLQTHRIVARSGSDGGWRWRDEEPDDMYQQEHDALFRSIREGAPIDDSEVMIDATAMAVMARLSAYTGQEVTWDALWASELDLAPPAYAWGEAPEPVVARPGVTKFS